MSVIAPTGAPAGYPIALPEALSGLAVGSDGTSLHVLLGIGERIAVIDVAARATVGDPIPVPG